MTHHSNQIMAFTEPVLQVSSPRNVHVDLTANGYLITWDPPEEGAHVVVKYQIRWFREGGEQSLEKGETIQHSYTSEFCNKFIYH